MAENDLIYDVGVNDGEDTAYYLERGFRVVGIEADPLLAEQLRGRFADAIRAGKFLLLNIGVAAQEGEAEFWISERSIWSSFDKSMASRDGLQVHAVIVPTRPMDAILREHGIPHYCKIDVEGFDRTCVAPITSEIAPTYMSIELSASDGDIDIRHLQQIGYSRFKIVSQVTRSQPAPWLMNAAYYSPWRVATKLVEADRRWRGVTQVGGWKFGSNCAGAFAEDTPGRWETFPEVMRRWSFLRDTEERRERKGLHNWFDLHAAR